MYHNNNLHIWCVWVCNRYDSFTEFLLGAGRIQFSLFIFQMSGNTTTAIQKYLVLPVGDGLYFSEFSLDNISAFLGNVDEVHQTHSGNIAIFGIVLVIVALLLNMAIICAILPSSVLRSQILYRCILNLCVVNIIMSVFINPLAIYVELGEKWNLPEFVCRSWIILDVILPFVSMLILCIATFDRFVYIYIPTLFSKPSSQCKTVSYNVLPWILTFLILLPLLISGSLATRSIPGYCILIFNKTTSILTPVITYFIPSFSLILGMIFTLMGNFRENDLTRGGNARSITSRSLEVSTSTTQTDFGHEHVSLVTLYISNCLYIAMWFPHQFVSFLLSFCNSCYPPYVVILGFTWLGASTSFFIPFMWLCNSAIRQRMVCMKKWRILKQKPKPTGQREGTEMSLMDV